MPTKMLIIDDDPIHHKMINLLIQLSGLEIEATSFFQAADGLSYILENNEIEALPDLILLDLSMPVVSGWGFLELFEEMSSRLIKPVDVIILTSSINSDDKQKASNYNCVKGFFSKPMTESMLKDIISSSFTSVNRTSKYYF